MEMCPGMGTINQSHSFQPHEMEIISRAPQFMDKLETNGAGFANKSTSSCQSRMIRCMARSQLGTSRVPHIGEGPTYKLACYSI
eukprot:4702996-Ditylum_brightwellii.AAC.1